MFQVDDERYRYRNQVFHRHHQIRMRNDDKATAKHPSSHAIERDSLWSTKLKVGIVYIHITYQKVLQLTEQ